MSDSAGIMSEVDKAAAVLAAARLNLFKRAQNGDKITPAEWDELRRMANDKSGAPAWPDRAALAAELGLTGHQVAGLARRGMPAEKTGHIDQVPVLFWLWQNRAELVALADDEDPEAEDRAAMRRQQIDKLRLANEGKSKQHLEVAQAFVARKFRELEASLVRDLTTRADGLWLMAQEPRTTALPKLVATLQKLVAETIDRGIAS